MVSYGLGLDARMLGTRPTSLVPGLHQVDHDVFNLRCKKPDLHRTSSWPYDLLHFNFQDLILFATLCLSSISRARSSEQAKVSMRLLSRTRSKALSGNDKSLELEAGCQDLQVALDLSIDYYRMLWDNQKLS